VGILRGSGSRSAASPAVLSRPPGWPPFECCAPAWLPRRSVVPLTPALIVARLGEPLSARPPEGRGHATPELEPLTQPVISFRPTAEHGYARSQLGVIGYDDGPIRGPADKLDDRVVRAARSRMKHGEPARPADGREANGGSVSNTTSISSDGGNSRRSEFE
jgi:hypothetical protein